MEPLIVSRALERPAKIGPFFWPELMALVLVALTLFFGMLLLRSTLGLSRWWLLLGPTLFVLVFALAKTFRGQAQPLLLLSWYSWYFLQPKKIRLQQIQTNGQVVATTVSEAHARF